MTFPLGSNLEPGSVDWWLVMLERKLVERRRETEDFDNYYDGRHTLGFATEKFQQAFGSLFESFADNWCGLVVDATEERLNIDGFRFGPNVPEAGAEGPTSDPATGDAKAWEIWQRNRLDAESQIGHTEALVHGNIATIVWNDPEHDGLAKVTVEHPGQVAVGYVAGDRRRRAAALKVWTDDTGRDLATLYLPDTILKFQSRRRGSGIGLPRKSRWEPRQLRTPDDDGRTVEDELENPLGVVPVVELHNRPRMLRAGVSELAPVIPLQDAANKLVADMLVASEFGAFVQRWATGVSIPKDPETGKPIQEFKVAVDRMFTSKDPASKFGTFEATDLRNFVVGIEMIVQHIASQTKTPPHYFYLRGQFPSGESIKAAETGLVAKVKRKQRHFGEGWEETIRLAFLVEDDARRGNYHAAETIWSDPESRSEAEHMDAVAKKRAIGVPLPQLWEEAGYTPTQIARFNELWKAERDVPAGAVAPAGQQPSPPGEVDE